VIRSKLIALMPYILLMGGCATSMTKEEGAWGQAYSGTPCSIKNISDAKWGFNGGTLLLLPLFLVDVPLSVVADTLVLPIDLVHRAPASSVGCGALMH
jgi:uncharacterized protein YceK